MKKFIVAALALAFSSISLGQSYPSPTYNNITVQGAANLTNPLTLSNGGTGSATAAGARTNLGLGTIATQNSSSVSITGGTVSGTTITGGTISGLSSPLPVASGGTNATAAGGTALDNITGFSSTGFLTRTGAGAYAFQSLTNGISYGNLAQAAANTVLGNATGSSGNVTALTVTGCNGAAQALQWTNGSGFGCNSSIATSGANANITSLSGLTTPLSVGQGGTGVNSFGTGVQTGLGANVNSGSGFVTYSQSILSGSGITPYAYGAVGNGVADDTTALQNWLNASAASGLTAFCSAGTYKITASLNLNSNNAYKIAGPGGSACNITSNMPTITVSGAAAGATYSGVPSIRLTVSSTTGIASAAEVTGVNGTTEVNGAWPAVVIDSTHVDFVGPTFAHAWTSSGWVVLPVIALSPPSPGASQPNLDISGVYFGTATNNNLTDAAVFTGPPAGSNVYAHDLVVNGTYRRGFLFYNSFAPIIKNVFFYNMRGAAVVANQDISFSNAVVDHSEFFSNGNIALEPSVIIGGANWVENPTFFNSQWSGNNSGGLNFAGNVFGATIVGNYLENNTAYNFSCTGSGNNGATITGNFFNYNSGTNNTSLVNCNAVFFSGNFLVNQSFSFGGNSQIPATNSFSGTSALTYPVVAPSSIISSTVATQAITSGAATNVTSLSVPAGSWACTGSTFTNPAGTTTQSFNVSALSTTANSFPATAPGEVIQSGNVAAGISIGQNVGPVYYLFGTTTTLYLVAQVNYATSTLTINGDIHCQRVF